MTETAAIPRRNARVAILIVNGFDKSDHWGSYDWEEASRYPWIDLCLRQIERYSRGWEYEVVVFDNSHLRQHHRLIEQYPRVRLLPGRYLARLGRLADRLPFRRVGDLFERKHPEALDYLIRHVAADVDYLVMLDSDSFPVRDDWLDVLVAECERGAALTGIYRDEMAPTIRPFIHVSGLCVRPADLDALSVTFSQNIGQDVGQNITEAFASQGRELAPLKRCNTVNFHFLIGGLYGDILYHHGAGSRRAGFWTSTDLEADERIRTTLRDAAFEDVDRLIAIIRGHAPNDLGLASA